MSHAPSAGEKNATPPQEPRIIRVLPAVMGQSSRVNSPKAARPSDAVSVEATTFD
jgi:hypothetical protein